MQRQRQPPTCVQSRDMQTGLDGVEWGIPAVSTASRVHQSRGAGRKRSPAGDAPQGHPPRVQSVSDCTAANSICTAPPIWCTHVPALREGCLHALSKSATPPPTAADRARCGRCQPPRLAGAPPLLLARYASASSATPVVTWLCFGVQQRVAMRVAHWGHTGTSMQTRAHRKPAVSKRFKWRLHPATRKTSLWSMDFAAQESKCIHSLHWTILSAPAPNTYFCKPATRPYA